jgi:hypothetical protein
MAERRGSVLEIAYQGYAAGRSPIPNVRRSEHIKHRSTGSYWPPMLLVYT